MKLAVLLAFLLSAAPALAGDPITFESLLREMANRDAIARFPDPAYTCRQFSSYDRASTTAADQKTWFANGDANQYLRVDEVKTPTGVRKEWVMMDADGPGAVVRFWSANPAGTVRVYLDGSDTPVIESPMTDLLGGKATIGGVLIGPPLSGVRARGWNLYLPVPYAKHCKITSDKDGFYYQINYRTYDPTARAVSLAVPFGKDTSLLLAIERLMIDGKMKESVHEHPIPPKLNAHRTIGPNESLDCALPFERYAIKQLTIRLKGAELSRACRHVILAAEFDGEQTVWSPVGDFFGSGVGWNPHADRYREVREDGTAVSRFVMPYAGGGTVRLINLGDSPVECEIGIDLEGFGWDARSMHFHATWRHQYPIHAYGGRGTEDWNYVDIQGKGVYVGDTLAVMNPVPEWWGEGDEKIYVDGETFPSHFGTGTEDYYGYAWCWPEAFSHPFHSQTRVDGQKRGNNWGHTTVTRVRSLDAIPFTKSFKFDMEVWHWKECDEAYAATTYFYALPGATTNRAPQPEEAAREIPQPPPLPPPFKLAGALECEDLAITARSPDLNAGPQQMDGFAPRTWSDESHLWVRAAKPGDFVELKIPAAGDKPRRLSLYATKSWDYGIVRFSVNGTKVGQDADLFSGAHGKVAATGPIDLGVHTPVNGAFTLRAEVVGANPASEGTKSFFALDCVVLGD